MSLSTLGQQLAVLNAPGQSAGFSKSSSKRNNEAVGRGVNFSVSAGHAVSRKSHLFKPSIIYEDAKKAADVPIATIRENCVAAFKELAAMDDMFASYTAAFCKTSMPERGMLTASENQHLDSQIQELITRLCTYLDCGKAITPACLHVIEYLLRKFDIHLRPQLASDTILNLLPFHEEPFMLRFLQLVDLSNTNWNFLRPYAAPGSSFARQLVSKEVAKNKVLADQLCSLVTRVAKTSRHDRTISFAAAVLVEAVAMQTKQTGSIHEPTCKSLLRWCQVATSLPESEAHRNWGYVVASSIIESSVLAYSARTALADSILNGLVNATERTRLNGMMLILSVLSQRTPHDTKATMLPIIGALPMGVTMEQQTFLKVLKVQDVTYLLGYIFAEEGAVTTGRLVASFSVLAWGLLMESQEASARELMKTFLLGLLEERDLSPVWKQDQGKMLASFVAHVLSYCKKQTDPTATNFGRETESILTSAQKLDAHGYDLGLAYALKVSNDSQRSNIATWVGIATPKASTSEDRWTDLLPPRIALDHADADVRASAVERLMKDRKERSEDEGETLLDALLRRFSVEDTPRVALTVGKAVQSLLSDPGVYTKENSSTVLESYFRWMETPSNVTAEVIELAFLLLTRTLPTKPFTIDDSLAFSQIVALAANLDGPNRDQAAAALCQCAGSTTSITKVTKARLFLSSELVLGAFRARDDTILQGAIEQYSYHKCLHATLTSFIECFKDQSMQDAVGAGEMPSHAENAIQFCLDALRFASINKRSISKKHDPNTQQYREHVKECLALASTQCSLSGPGLISLLHALGSTSPEDFDSMIAPMLKSLCSTMKDSAGGSVALYATVMEATLSSDSPEAVQNLLSLVETSISKESAQGAEYAIVPTLALTIHTHETVRAKAITILKSVAFRISKGTTASQFKSLTTFLSHLCTDENTIILGGMDGIYSAFTGAVSKTGQPEKLQKLLGALCVYASAAYGGASLTNASKAFHHSWLANRVPAGGSLAAATVLRMMEMAGEDSIPLNMRWKHAGSPIFNGLTSRKIDSRESKPADGLIYAITRMLGGFLAPADESTGPSQKLTITTGPSSNGRRSRSYSVDKNERGQFIQPYPKDMLKAFCGILKDSTASTMVSLFQASIYRVVLGSSQWGRTIFHGLPTSSRKEIVTALIVKGADNITTECENALFTLPLTTADLASLIQGFIKTSKDTTQISLLSDYVFTKASELTASKDISKLLSVMFAGLMRVTAYAVQTNGNTSNQDHDFACQSIIAALAAVYQHMERKKDNPGQEMKELDDHQDFASWMERIVVLLGGSAPKVQALSLSRSRLTLIRLMASMSIIHPKPVSQFVMPALLANVKTEVSGGFVSAAQFRVIMPHVFRLAKTQNLSIPLQFKAFVDLVERSTEGGRMRRKVYKAFVEGMKSPAGIEDFSPVGGVIATLLAVSGTSGEATEAWGNDGEKMSIIEVAVKIMRLCNPKTQVNAAVWIAASVRKILTALSGDSMVEDEASRFSTDDIRMLVAEHRGSGLETSSTQAEKKTDLLKFCNDAILVVSEALMADNFAAHINASTGDESSNSLELWQDLLLLQSMPIPTIDGVDTGFIKETMTETVKESHEYLQSYLPLPVFLAATTTLINEGETSGIRSRALKLLASRAENVEANSAEAALFSDLFPLLVSLLNVNASKEPGQYLVQQSALNALETMVRVFGLPSISNTKSKRAVSMSTLESALKASSSLSLHLSYGFEDMTSPDALAKAAGPMALKLERLSGLVRASHACCAMLVRACGARSLPFLGTMMESFIKTLSIAHELFPSNAAVANSMSDDDDEDDLNDLRQQLRVFQVSTVQTLDDLIQTIPQFVSAYIEALLSDTVLCSKTLQIDGRKDGEIMVHEAMKSMEETFASKIPARQLISRLAVVMTQCENVNGMVALLSILRKSVEKASGSETVSLSQFVVSTCLHVFENSPNSSDDTDDDEEAGDLDANGMANQVLLTMIMKLSEVQLRPVFMKLRDWRGDFNKENPNENAHKRLAFWSLCSLLGEELKSIFLPCLGTVFNDAVDELSYAVTQLCSVTGKKLSEGKKKRKMATGSSGRTNGQGQPVGILKPLLRCMEVSLEADARAGGEWIRADNSQRYNLLLEPLCRLLQSEFSNTNNSPSDKFASIVEGKGSSDGNVVGTIVALASAAGDEQLWKPLNHSVLQAASHEDRSDVRRAGVSCLLELVRTLGEEYMVLLPECLPVLSELLEDDDERISGAARDCIELSEELLGESLEDSLR